MVLIMEWQELKEEQQLNHIKDLSSGEPVVIFKHSTRCSISSTALNRLERSWKPEEVNGIKPFYLDLISFRNISNKIEDVFKVRHESPQLLIIKNGNCVYHASHMGINYEEIKKQLSA